MRRPVVVANAASGGLWWRIPLAVLIWLPLALPQVGSAVVWAAYQRYAEGLPEVPDLAAYARAAPRTNEIRAADGTLLAELPFNAGGVTGHRRWLPYDKIPERVRLAILAAEDVRFFDHTGVDLRAVLRAAWANWRAGRSREGASTLTQQLARNLLPVDIGKEKTTRRKIREMILALRIERRWDKQTVFETYANLVFLGANAYGVSAAARRYFDKDAADLSLAEAALVAGMAQAPGRTNPFIEPKAARARRDEILDKMERAGFISEEERRKARREALTLHPPAEVYGTISPWLTELARRQALAMAPVDYARGGLIIETSALPATQLLAEKAAADGAQALAARDKIEVPQVSVYLYDHRTGYVEAIVGGASYATSKFDRATEACRQPGSAFKPLVYAAAIEKDLITPGTALRDAPVAEYDENRGSFWKPASGHGFKGVALAQDALAASLNSPAIDVMDRVGPAAAVSFARRLGITTELAPVRPLVLGASCVIPADLARAFGTFAAGGRLPAPTVIVRIRSQDGGVVLVDRASPSDPWLAPERRLDRVVALLDQRKAPAVDPVTAFLVGSMLGEVTRSGTAHDASALGRPVAGKTGTTNQNTDAWFVGYTARVLAAVWVGYDDPKKQLGSKDDGAHAALPVWLDVIRAAEGERPALPVAAGPPAGVVSARIDRETGLLARPRAGSSAEDLWFRAGTVPTQTVEDAREIPRELDSVTHGF